MFKFTTTAQLSASKADLLSRLINLQLHANEDAN